jgi:hypothetical protein
MDDLSALLRVQVERAQGQAAAAPAGGLGVQPQDQRVQFRVIACARGSVVDLCQPVIRQGAAGGRQLARLGDLTGRVVCRPDRPSSTARW